MPRKRTENQIKRTIGQSETAARDSGDAPEAEQGAQKTAQKSGGIDDNHFQKKHHPYTILTASEQTESDKDDGGGQQEGDKDREEKRGEDQAGTEGHGGQSQTIFPAKHRASAFLLFSTSVYDGKGELFTKNVKKLVVRQTTN